MSDSSPRDLQVWHVPKRSSSHQMVGSINIFLAEGMDGNPWNLQKKETFNTRLGQWGFTESGGPLAQSARRTLEAMLKYVGLIFVVEKGNRPILLVSEVGKELQSKNSYSRPRSRKRLSDTIKQNFGWNTLEVIRDQFKKLIITNPVIKADCINILVFPFRAVLRLLLDSEIVSLSHEELAYIVFSMRSCSEHELVKQRILNFRSLSSIERNRELSAFKKTPVGNKTLVQAPTVLYFIKYCMITGFCISKRIAGKTCLLIHEEKRKEIEAYLKEYAVISAFDFGSDVDLWIDYFGEPSRHYPPIPVDFVFENPDAVGIALTYFSISKPNKLRYLLLDRDNASQTVALFPGEEYQIELMDVDSGSLVEKRNIRVTNQTKNVSFSKKGTSAQEWTLSKVKKAIKELLCSKSGIDSDYEKRLKLYSILTSQPDYIQDSRASLRGGRLEYLFYQFFLMLENGKVIDSVIWNGTTVEFGRHRPAPGGKAGNPDLVLSIKHIKCPIELTTIGNARAQWSAEGVSVHDHVKNFQAEFHVKEQKIIGIFSAPTIHDPMRPSLASESKRQKRPILCLTIDELISIFSEKNRDEIVTFLETEGAKLLAG